MPITAVARQATPEDMDAIRLCHAEIEAQMGKSLDLPAVHDPSILGYYVVERDGRIIGGLYLEKSVQECHFGTDPEATAALRAIQEDIFSASKGAGVRFLHCKVYREMEAAEKIGHHLEKSGFINRDDLLHFSKDLG